MGDGVLAVPVGLQPFGQNPIHQSLERRSMVERGSPQVPGELLVDGVDEDHVSSSSHRRSLTAAKIAYFPLIRWQSLVLCVASASAPALLAVSHLYLADGGFSPAQPAGTSALKRKTRLRRAERLLASQHPPLPPDNPSLVR